MNRLLRPRPLTVLLILLVATFLVAASAPVTSVKVRPGDSISYLAFKHLHTYNQEIVNQIKSLNPHIKDLNLIQIGQTVYLPERKPSTVKGKRGEPTPSAPPPETKKITTEDPTPLEQVNPRIHPTLAAVVMRLLAKEPGDRYQSGAEVVSVLKSLIEDPSIWK